MQKLTIIYPFNPIGKKAGGIETFMRGIIKYLSKDIVISIVGLINDPEEQPLGEWSTIVCEGKEIPFFPVMIEGNEDKRERIPLSIRFTLALKQSKIDLTGHDLFFHRIEPAILFLNNKHKKYFVVHHDIEKFLSKNDCEVVWAKFPWLYKIFEKIIYKYATKVLTVNGKTLIYYKETYKQIAHRFEFIPTCVDTEIFYPLPNDKECLKQQLGSEYSIPSDRKWILFVGRLQKQKAPEKLIQVLSQLDHNHHLVIVGDGNLRSELDVLCKALQLEERVHFLGTMMQEAIRALFQVSDLFLLTSNFEGMPICLLEAHACGLPIVSTPVGEVARIIDQGKSGVIVENHAVDSIANSVNHVLQNQSSFSSQNCIEAMAQFTAPAVIKKMFSL